MLTQVEQLIYEEAYEQAYERAAKEITASAIASTIRICQNLHAAKEDILHQLTTNFRLPEETALEYLQTHWK